MLLFCSYTFQHSTHCRYNLNRAIVVHIVRSSLLLQPLTFALDQKLVKMDENVSTMAMALTVVNAKWDSQGRNASTVSYYTLYS